MFLSFEKARLNLYTYKQFNYRTDRFMILIIESINEFIHQIKRRESSNGSCKTTSLKNDAWTLIRESDSKLASGLVVTDDAINFVMCAKG